MSCSFILRFLLAPYPCMHFPQPPPPPPPHDHSRIFNQGSHHFPQLPALPLFLLHISFPPSSLSIPPYLSLSLTYSLSPYVFFLLIPILFSHLSSILIPLSIFPSSVPSFSPHTVVPSFPITLLSFLYHIPYTCISSLLPSSHPSFISPFLPFFFIISIHPLFSPTPFPPSLLPSSIHPSLPQLHSMSHCLR